MFLFVYWVERVKKSTRLQFWGGDVHDEHLVSILSELQISTSGEVPTLRRIQKHGFCAAFIVILLKTGERSQLKNTKFTIPFGWSSHSDSSSLHQVKRG